MSSGAVQGQISAAEPKWKQDPGVLREPRYIPDEIINWDSMDVVQPRPSKTMRPRPSRIVAPKEEHQPQPQATATLSTIEQKSAEPTEERKRKVHASISQNPTVKREQKEETPSYPRPPPPPPPLSIQQPPTHTKPKRARNPRKQGQTQEDKKGVGATSATATTTKPRPTASSTSRVASAAAAATTTTTTSSTARSVTNVTVHQCSHEVPVVVVSSDTIDPPLWVKYTPLQEAVMNSGGILEELFIRGGEVNVGVWLKYFCHDPSQCLSILRGWFRTGVLSESLWTLLAEEAVNVSSQTPLVSNCLGRIAVICYLAALMRFQLKRGQKDVRVRELTAIQCITMSQPPITTATAATFPAMMQAPEGSFSASQHLHYSHPVAATTDASCLCSSVFQRSDQEEARNIAAELSTTVMSICSYRRLFCIIAKLHAFQSQTADEMGIQERLEEAEAAVPFHSQPFTQPGNNPKAPPRAWITKDPVQLSPFDLREFILHRLQSRVEVIPGLRLPAFGMTLLDCLPEGIREYAFEKTSFKSELCAFVAEKQSRDAQRNAGDQQSQQQPLQPSEWSKILTWKNAGRGRGRKKANGDGDAQAAWKTKKRSLTDLAESGFVATPGSKRPKLGESVSFTPGGVADTQSPSDFFNSATNSQHSTLASSSHTAADVALGITSFGLGVEGAPGVALEDLLPPGTLANINSGHEQPRFDVGSFTQPPQPPPLPKRGQNASGRRGNGATQRQQHPRRPANGGGGGGGGGDDDDVKVTCPLCNQEFKTATRHGRCSICGITCKEHGKKSRSRTLPPALPLIPSMPFQYGAHPEVSSAMPDDMIVYDEPADNKTTTVDEKAVVPISPLVKPLDLINKLPNPKFDVFLAHILGVDYKQMLSGGDAAAHEAYQYINQPGFKTRNIAIESCFGCRTGKRFCCECMVNGWVDRRHIFVGLMRADNQGTRKVRVAYLCSYKCLVLIRAGTGGLFEAVSELKRLKIKDEHEATELENSLRQQQQEEIINFDTETSAPTIPIPSLGTSEQDAPISFDQDQGPVPRHRSRDHRLATNSAQGSSGNTSSRTRDVMRYHYENKRTPGRSALSRDVFYLDDPDLPLIFRLNNERNSNYLKEAALKAVEAKKRAEGRGDNDDSGSTDSFEKKMPGPILEEQEGGDEMEGVEGLRITPHHINNSLVLQPPPQHSHLPQETLYAPVLPTLAIGGSGGGGGGFDLMGEDLLHGQVLALPGDTADMDIDLSL